MATLFFIALFIVVGIALLTVKVGDTQYPIKFKKIGYASFGLAIISFVAGSFTIIEPGVCWSSRYVRQCGGTVTSGRFSSDFFLH